MPVPLIKSLAIILTAVFGWAAIAKVIRWPVWRGALSAYGLPAPTEPLAAVATPLAEGAVAALLIAGQTLTGAAAGLALLSMFSFVVLRARARQGDRLPCGCFGKVTSRDYRTLLIRNGVLSLIVAALLLGGENASFMRGVTFTRGSVVPVLLIVAGIVVVAWMFAYAAPALRQKERLSKELTD